MRRAGVLALASLGLVASSCDDIEARRRSNAPLNSSADFPCERYVETPVKAVPSEGRCIVATPTTFDFTIVVNVPETSHYAAGHTFVLTNADATRSGEGSRIKLPVLGNVNGAYQVAHDVSKAVGYEVPEGQSIPVNAVYTPIGRDERTTYNAALPLDVVFASSRIVDLDSPTIAYLRSLPAGRWTRAFEPAPPYDAFFPPHIADVQVKRSGDVFDLVDIRALDDPPPGTSRNARVTRAEGLDDWKVWLVDHASGRRISTLKTLEGTEAKTRLDTTGRGTSLEGVDAIVAPPEGWIGVPRLVVELIAGSGLGNLAYPELRVPVALEGIVAASADAGVFLAVASRVTFASETITLPTGAPQPLLKYSTSVSTDDRGRFASVLPPGTYTVTVEPLEGTGFASFRKQVVIEDNSPITLSPLRRTHVRGVALLTDGRPAGSAEVLASAEPLVDTTAQPPPRPARTRVREDGTFSFDLDHGAYVFTVIPEAGTGFPRVVTRATIPVDQADIGVVRIPPPTRLGLEVVDPTNLLRPIPSAHVRIFAAPEGGGGPALEIGNGITNGVGKVEILLAQQPK